MSRMDRSDRILAGLACLISCVGLIVMAGWCLNVRHVVQIAPDLIPMHFNTALGMLIAGAGAVLTIADRRRAALVLTILLTLLGSFTLFEWCRNVDFGIDRFLIRSNLTDILSGPHAGRMSAISASLFVMTGLAWTLLNLRFRRPLRAGIAGAIGTVSLGVAALACSGYAVDIKTAYFLGQRYGIAPSTAICFAFLAGITLAYAWRIKLGGAGRLARAPLAAAAASFIVAVGLWAAIVSEQRAQEASYVKAVATVARDEIQDRVNVDVHALRRMALRWEMDGETNEARWRCDARAFERDMPEFTAIELIDTRNFRVRAVEPLKGNERALTLDVRTGDIRRAAIERAKAGQTVISRPFDLVQGGKGFLIYVPLTAHGKPDGLLCGVFKLTGIVSVLPGRLTNRYACLFYTSDAADDMQC